MGINEVMGDDPGAKTLFFKAFVFMPGDSSDLARFAAKGIRENNGNASDDKSILMPTGWKADERGAYLALTGCAGEVCLPSCDGSDAATLFGFGTPTIQDVRVHLESVFNSSCLVVSLLIEDDAETGREIEELERFANSSKMLGYPMPSELVGLGLGPISAAEDAGVLPEGRASEAVSPFEDLIGLESIKESLCELARSAATQKRRGLRLPNLSMVFVGNAGTGKSVAARAFHELLRQEGVIPKKYTFSEISGKEGSFLLSVRTSGTGALINDIGKLSHKDVRAIEAWLDNDSSMPCDDEGGTYARYVVIAGTAGEIESLMRSYPQFENRMGLRLAFDDLDARGMQMGIQSELASRGHMLGDEAKDCLASYCERMVACKGKEFGNYRLVQGIANRISVKCTSSSKVDEVVPASAIEDVLENEFSVCMDNGGHGCARIGGGGSKVLETSARMAGDEQLDRLIGLEKPKKLISEYLDFATVQLKRGQRVPSLHMRFDGNPGTGKSTLARVVGQMMGDRGLLASGDNFVETDRSGLVGEYIGQSEKQTRELLEKARHGVLFIDEAYALNANSDRDFGNDVLALLVKEMESCLDDFANRGFVCIMAGYPEPMERLMSVNPGLRDRIGLYVPIEDYSVSELMQIFDLFVADGGFEATDDAREMFERNLKRIAESQLADFSNARMVRKLVERLMVRQCSLHGDNNRFGIDVVESVFDDDDFKGRIDRDDPPIGFF